MEPVGVDVKPGPEMRRRAMAEALQAQAIIIGRLSGAVAALCQAGVSYAAQRQALDEATDRFRELQREYFEPKAEVHHVY